MAEATINLGPEHDARLRQALKNAIEDVGALVAEPEWIVVGSQEITSVGAQLDGRHFIIESETYVGLCLKGDRLAIEHVANRTREIYAAS